MSKTGALAGMRVVGISVIGVLVAAAMAVVVHHGPRTAELRASGGPGTSSASAVVPDTSDETTLGTVTTKVRLTAETTVTTIASKATAPLTTARATPRPSTTIPAPAVTTPWNPLAARSCDQAAFNSYPPQNKTPAVVPNQAGLAVVRPDGGGYRMVVPTPNPIDSASFSPDGGQLVYAALDGKGGAGLFVVNSDGTGNHRIASQAQSPLRAAWSPNGAEIAFVDGGALFVTDAGGTNIRQIDAAFPGGGRPRWSPDSTRIASAGAGGVHLVAVSTASTSTIAVPSPNDVSWSPDGHRLAFASGDQGAYTVNDDGSGLRVIRHQATAAVWSPDGADIAVDVAGITLCHLDGTVDRNLGSTAVTVDHWSPDSTMATGPDIGGGITLARVDLSGNRLLVGPAPGLSPHTADWSAATNDLAVIVTAH